MKWMKKLRLINWHYFTDVTMEFGKQTLITGQNGAGKSTIIDALQVLFVADQRQIRFNPAAHEEAKRTMINYLRGKIGNDDRTFVRNGDFTSYIVAEFRDDEKKESFVVGVVMDIFRDQSYEEEYFILANRTLDSLTFVKPSGHLRNRDEFKRLYHNDGATRARTIFERNKTNYQKALLARMGQVHERFFSIFTKALSFKPIQNIRDFIYDYILGRRELQLDLMKQNFEIHERYKQELEELQKRKEKLLGIRNSFQQYAKLRETVIEQDYVLRRLKRDMEQETLEQHEQTLNDLEKAVAQLADDIQFYERKREEAAHEKEEAYQRWKSHSAEQQKRQLGEEIQQLEIHEKETRQQLSLWAKQLQQELSVLQALTDWNGNEVWKWEPGEQEQLVRTRETVAHVLAVIEKGQSGVEHDEGVLQTFRSAGLLLLALHERFLVVRTRLEDQLREVENRLAELERVIRDLEDRKRPYPPSVARLKELLEECFSGRSHVWIFCEEMEIEDEVWRDAVEGYLNTQRFDLLVEPEVFAEALSVYEKEKFTYKLEGVGLVDTEKERKYLGRSEPGSLAEAVKAEHPVIRAHMEHLLGKVMKAANEQELREHRTAITSTCMLYQNLVARQIPKDRYAIPYIGAQAIVRQLEIKRAELARAKAQQKSMRLAMEELSGWAARLAQKHTQYERILDNVDLPTRLRVCLERLAAKRKELTGLDMSEAERLKADYEEWRRMEEDWNQKSKELTGLKAQREENKKNLSAVIYLQQRRVREAHQFLEQWLQENGPEKEQRALVRWEEAQKQDLPTARKIDNWENNWKGNQTRRDDAFRDLQLLRQEFNIEYSFSGPITSEENDAYESLLYNIEHLNIPEYQKKVELALKESEEEFKTHFLLRMREAIQMARKEFDQLNYALRHFPFSDDKYHFEVSASEKYKNFYDAIMDPMLMEKGSLFDIPDNDRSEVLHHLFELLVRGDTGDIEEFTDYRRYLDFDIIVTTRDSRYRFSQVLKEKSGGETQTPFYIAILASFHHLYASGKTMRLVVFDEAFNKMDEQRIQTSLRLIKQMNLQLIAAVPDEKMQHMAPEVTTTLIVSNQNYECFVDIIDRWDAEDEVASTSAEDSTRL
ncbi:MAG: AAA family ATPase [Brevibacillus sp.]|nr:AAA family ATPase [Brevibacillus sp.]